MSPKVGAGTSTSRSWAGIVFRRREQHLRPEKIHALSSLTPARAELLAGNREVALREVRLAQAALTWPGGRTQSRVPVGLSDALAKGEDALSRGSGAAADWLSLAWHQLADAILAGP